MKRPVLIVLSLCFLVLSGINTANTQEICSNEKTEAITEYLNVNSIDDLMDQVLIEMEKQIPPEGREFFTKMWKAAFDKNELKEFMVTQMCKHFTHEEIKALTNFYGSPEGKSIIKKMPQYMAELMPYLQVINQRAMQKAIEEINKKQNEEVKNPKKL